MKQNRLKSTIICALFALFTLVITISFWSVDVLATEPTVNYTLGDVNNDSVVNSADAIWLLRHTLFPSKYVINQPADFNNDGKEDSGDAIWLLRHTLFPSKYPLHTPVYYNITWKNYDGTILATTSATMGSTPTYSGATPTKEGTDQVSYTFKGWTPTLSVVSSDAVYTAQFEEGVRTYTVTWKNYDGTVLKTDSVQYNNTPSYSGSTPQRESDATYQYSFTGWGPKIGKATRDVSYLAQFSQSARTSFTIRYDANGGSNAPSSQTKSKGSSIALSSSVPQNGDHVFMGWACGNDGKTYSASSSFTVDADVTLYAVWGHTCETCNGAGSISSTNTCSNCSGKGTISTPASTWVSCSSCNGKGKITVSYTGVCSSCGGWGGRVLCNCSCGNAWWADQAGSRKCSRCGKIVQGTRYTTCSNCNGSGTEKKTQSSTCTACNGSGGRYVSSSHTSTCSSCNGTGKKTVTTTCSVCNGNKQIKEYTTSYSITLYNGGIVFGSASVIQNNPYKLNVPTKSGYEFVGWFDAASGGTQYTNEAGVSFSVWNSTSGKNLYAHWRLKYYSITYDCDAYVKLKNLPSVYTVEDSNISLPTQERDYYSFRWEIDGQTVARISTSSVKSLIVKGIWTPIEYKISYSLNGGNATNKTTYNVETATFKLTNPTKTGYTFTGWTGSNGDTPQTDVSIAKGTQGDLSFTANWKINQYTITFNSNGGSSIAPITQDYNTKVQAPDIPSQNRKSFVGWFNASFTNEYHFDKMPAKNITLYAKWIDYRVTISADEKKYISVEDALTPQLFNATAVDSDGNSVSIRVETNAGTQTAGDTLTVTLVAEGLYGVKDEKQYTLTVLDVNQSILYLYKNGKYIGSKNVYKNQAFLLDCDAGYDTIWYLNGKAITDKSGASLTTWSMEPDGYDVSSNPTPTAYTITYDLNGGKVSGTNPVTYNIESNSITLIAPSRIGYTFTGWSGTDIEGVEKTVTILKGSIGDRTYTANWQINTYTITYILNNGTIANGVNPVEYTYEDNITLVAPTREYCKFLGWYSDGKKIEKIYQSTGNLTLTAEWECAFNLSGNTITGLTDYGKTLTALTIPNNFEGTDITSIASSAFKDCTNLTNVVISDSITSIGTYAFQGCTKLTSITIPSSVTTIGTGAFKGCSSLASMEIPFAPTYFGSIFGASSYSNNASSVPTSLKTVVVTGGTSISRSAFYECKNIKSLTIPNTVTTIGEYAFHDCTGITNFVVPNSVTTIGVGAFKGCTGLTTLSVPFLGKSNSATAYEAVLGYIFGYETTVRSGSGSSTVTGQNSSSTTFIDMQYSSVAGATWQYSCFNSYGSYYGPSGGSYYDLSGSGYLYTVGYRLQSYFYHIPISLKNVTVTGSKVSDYAFFNCTRLTNVTLNDTVTSIGTNAFKNCNANVVYQ